MWASWPSSLRQFPKAHAAQPSTTVRSQTRRTEPQAEMLTPIGPCLVSARPARSSTHKERLPQSKNALPRREMAELRALQREWQEKWLPTQDTESRKPKRSSTLGDGQRLPPPPHARYFLLCSAS